MTLEQIIIPDTSATREVDLVRLQLESTMRRAELEAADPESEIQDLAREAAEDARQALSDLESSEEPRPTVTIGYLPSRKLSSLRNASMIARRGKFSADTATHEQLDAITDIMREYVRWGVRGHRDLGFDFESVKECIGPFEHDVASWMVVDVYERIGMLPDLFSVIQEYNELSQKKSKPSSCKPGTSHTTTTAEPASKNPS